jgi:hypothetical protein
MDYAIVHSTPAAGPAMALLWLLIDNKTVGFASCAVALALIWRGQDRFGGDRWLAALAVTFLCLRAAIFLAMYDCWDFQAYYQIGTATVAGTDPYSSLLSQYPVNALPLFGLFALVPLRAASILWYGFNIVAVLLSIRLAAGLARRPGEESRNVPWYGNVILLLAMFLAGATTWALDAGQLVAWTTLWVYLGIAALRRGHEIRAGLALAAASLKITTSLPFLLLPLDLKRKRARALLVFGAAVVILCCAVYPPRRLLALERSHMQNVAQARHIGEINDYTFAGPYHDDLLGLEHWLYCLGLRNPAWISAGQLGLLAIAGLGLLWDFRIRSRPPDERLLAVLLCLYACLFLYHRIYDAVIVALPLAYCLEQARSSTRGKACTYRAIASGLILVLNFPRGGLLLRFADWTQHAGLPGRLAQILVLPACNWILIAAFGLLWYLGRSEARFCGLEKEVAGNQHAASGLFHSVG